jgi:hypothetical protein
MDEVYMSTRAGGLAVALVCALEDRDGGFDSRDGKWVSEPASGFESSHGAHLSE